MERQNQEKIIQNLKNLDKSLRTFRGQFTFKLNEVSVELVGNKSDFPDGNKKHISFGIANQSMNIIKDFESIRLNLFGITIGIFNNF